MRRQLLIIVMLSASLLSCSDDKHYHVENVEIFKNTPVWPLAKAIQKHDTADVRRLLEEHPDWVEFHEPKFEVTLLYWTFYNTPYNFKGGTYYEESKLLIEHGANPYFVKDGEKTPIMAAADIHDESFKYIQLCLNSGYTQQLPDSLRRIYLSEALIVAAGKILEEVDAVKVLLDAGADINYFNKDSTKTALSNSLIHRNVMIARYLIVERNARYDYCIKKTVSRSDWSVDEILNVIDFPNGPEKYPIKQEILDYINAQKAHKRNLR